MHVGVFGSTKDVDHILALQGLDDDTPVIYSVLGAAWFPDEVLGSLSFILVYIPPSACRADQ